MGMTMRVSLPGYDALTDGTIDHYSIYADSDNILIKEQSRGVATVNWSNGGTIAHNLGHIPFYLAFCEVSTGRYKLSTYFNIPAADWKLSVDTANLYIWNSYGTAVSKVRYYIFHDKL